jgi:hypothetical protein
MDTTASSFTARNNAKRAAEKMITDGKAPAVVYSIRPRDDGRFEIVWKTAPTNGEIEAEIATAASAAEDGHYKTETVEASADQPAAASSTEAGSQPAPAATKLATTGARRGPPSEAEIAPYPKSATTDPRRGIEQAYAEKRMATRHPRDGAQAQIVA